MYRIIKVLLRGGLLSVVLMYSQIEKVPERQIAWVNSEIHGGQSLCVHSTRRLLRASALSRQASYQESPTPPKMMPQPQPLPMTSLAYARS